MRKIIFLILSFVLFAQIGFAQFNDSNNNEVNQAITLLNGFNGRFDKNKAFEVINNYAHKGHPKAMNALGLMFMDGIIVQPDTVQGLNWLKLSSENNYGPTWHNLGIIYKYGRSGVKLNLSKAFYYMNLSANAGYPIGYYDAGYMLFKGLGCTQNYEKAIQFFTKGANLNSSSCMYMLGISYRNGYGIDRNMGEANFWLKKAIENGHSIAHEELALDNPENVLSRIKVKGTNTTIASPDSFNRIKHLKTINHNNVNGDYEGVLITYDWSGKHVIKESPLTLSIYSYNNQLLVEWREKDIDTIKIRAIWKDTCLMFNESYHKRTDHYSGENAVAWNFTNATLNLLNLDETEFLVGNLQMFSPETLEPQHPIYISLKKKVKLENEIQSNSINKEELSVYPNPFSDGLNIGFYQSEDKDVKIGIYSTNGSCVYSSSIGDYKIGQHNFTLQVQLNPGIYVLKLISGDNQYQSVIVKK